MPAKKSTGSYKCDKCDRTFSMAAHLARHMSTLHASPAAKAKDASKKKRKGAKKGVAKRAGAVGRPTGLVTRLGLRDMSLEQLRDVIDASRLEAQVKIEQYRSAFL